MQTRCRSSKRYAMSFSDDAAEIVVRIDDTANLDQAKCSLACIKPNWSCAIRSNDHDCRWQSHNWILRFFSHIRQSRSLNASRLFAGELKQGPCNKSQPQIDDVLFHVECVYEISVVKLFFFSSSVFLLSARLDLFILQMQRRLVESVSLFAQVMRYNYGLVELQQQ